MRILKRVKTQAKLAFLLFAIPYPSFIELYKVYEYLGYLYMVY